MPQSDGLEALLAYPGRATRALIDLDVLHENARLLRAHIGDSVELMAVVKADGYGHGAVMVAREAIAAGATWLGVATVAEGQELRTAGLHTPILVLGPILPSEVDGAIASRLDITVGDETLAEAVIARAHTRRSLPRLHLKVDTGMHRYGLLPNRVMDVLGRLEANSPGGVFALCSHFASADDPTGKTAIEQDRLLRDVTNRARQVRPDLSVHAANSSATLVGLAGGTSIARVGIALYGCGVSGELTSSRGLRQSLSVVSRFMRLHVLEPGDGVSYGHTYVASAPERVGLIPIGYADGYHRALSNVGVMGFAGGRLSVRGRVCMDQTVIGDVPVAARPGDSVGVAGPVLGGPTWDELAELASTISYELLTSVGRRVARLYHRSGRLVAARDELGQLDEIVARGDAPTT